MAKPTKRFSHDEVRFVEIRDHKSGRQPNPLGALHDFFHLHGIDPVLTLQDTGFIWKGLLRGRDLGPVLRWCEANDFVQEI